MFMFMFQNMTFRVQMQTSTAPKRELLVFGPVDYLLDLYPSPAARDSWRKPLPTDQSLTMLYTFSRQYIQYRITA